MATEMLDRHLSIGDYVVFYTNIYKVVALPANRRNGHDYVKIMILDPSPTSKPVKKHSGEMCLIPTEDVVAWCLKTGKTLSI